MGKGLGIELRCLAQEFNNGAERKQTQSSPLNNPPPPPQYQRVKK